MIDYDHSDPEDRTSTLRVSRWNDYGDERVAEHADVLEVRLTDDEAISLYEQLRATWARYLAERDAARVAVSRGVTLNEYMGRWAEDAYDGYEPTDPKHPAFLENADMIRDAEGGK
jgi:hypothetical protein